MTKQTWAVLSGPEHLIPKHCPRTPTLSGSGQVEPAQKSSGTQRLIHNSSHHQKPTAEFPSRGHQSRQPLIPQTIRLMLFAWHLGQIRFTVVSLVPTHWGKRRSKLLPFYGAVIGRGRPWVSFKTRLIQKLSPCLFPSTLSFRQVAANADQPESVWWRWAGGKTYFPRPLA